VRDSLGDDAALLSSDKARRLLGYEPAHSWRDSIRQPAARG
jgi:UDP-glucose 4-epimerase